jgi:hypothetical protein
MSRRTGNRTKPLSSLAAPEAVGSRQTNVSSHGVTRPSAHHGDLSRTRRNVSFFSRALYTSYQQNRPPLPNGINSTRSPVAKNSTLKISRTRTIHPTHLILQMAHPWTRLRYPLPQVVMQPSTSSTSSPISNIPPLPKTMKRCRRSASYACEYTLSDRSSTF